MSQFVLSSADLEQEGDSMLALLAELVMEDTPPGNKDALDRLLGVLRSHMEASGATCNVKQMATTGNILFGEWPSDRPKAQAGGHVLLLGHLDTVWPVGEVAKRPFAVNGSRATGPGILDMKAGLVIFLHAMRALHERGVRPPQRVVAVINCDEEVGSLESREAIEGAAQNSSGVLVLEPAMPDGSLKTSRKGSGHFRLICRGRAAHAGAFPELGISAVEELARQTLHLHGMTDLGAGTTVNVGTIRGGTQPNVIAAEAEGVVDVRARTVAEMARLERGLRDLRPVLPGASLELSGAWERPPMERTAENLSLFQHAQRVALLLGFNVGEGSSGAASDGNFTSAMGIPTLDGLGAIGEGPHAVEEFIEIPSLVERAALLASLIMTLDADFQSR